MDQYNPTGGPANTPPFGTDRSAVNTAADHQIPEQTSPAHGARTGGGGTETERELERTRDVLAEAAAPVMAEKTQEAIEETASRLQNDPEVRSQVKRTVTAMQHDAQQMARDKVGEIADQAEQRVNAQMGRAADRLEQAAHQVDQMADQRLGNSGMQARAGQMAHSLADTMESVAEYMRNNDVQGLRTDLERQMRERPMQTLLIAVATGWVAGKILR